MHADLKPARAFLHPVWWIALALLVANDHLFKGAGVFPGALTGKLSDVVGMLVAPALLAAMLGVATRRGWLLAHVAVGLVFAAINISPGVARMVEAASLATPFPWVITVDPTDLFTLPMLAVSAAVFGRWIERPIAVRPALTRLGVALGGVACMATSEPEEAPPWPEPMGWSQDVLGSVLLVNRTTRNQVVRTRVLRSTVQLDCDALFDDPSRMLSPDLFEAPILWSIQPALAIGLGDGRWQDVRTCDAILLGTPAGDRLVLIDNRAWAPNWQTLWSDDGKRPSHIELTEVGERLALSEHETLRAMPDAEVSAPEPACQQRSAGAGLAWTEPPTSHGVVVGTSKGPDGCYAVDIDDGRDIGRWYACVPGVELPIAVEDAIGFAAYGSEAGFTLAVRVGDTDILLQRSSDGRVQPAGIELDVRPVAGGRCPGHRDACDGFVRPMAVSYGERVVEAGASLVADGAEVHVIRAEHAVVADEDCDAWSVGPRLELVVILDPEFAR